ncbi:MAG: DUF3179 domain-containing protein [Halobacteriaceae archaeon]
MDRRTFLRLSLGGAAGGVAGCAGRLTAPTATGGGAAPTEDGTTTADSDATTATTATTADSMGSVAGAELPIPTEELVRGAPKNAIPAITDPVFGEDWSGVEITRSGRLTGNEEVSRPRLAADDAVIGVEREGAARAYPLKLLNWHEIVNDEFGGPLLVTYCPLCGTGVTAHRRVDGEPTVFGVSGYLYKSNLVMFDQATESLWSQTAATAINGPKTGTTLSLLPSSITTWKAWTEAHPDTTVLRPPPESGTITGREAVRDYSQNPYAGYGESESIGIGRNDFEDDRLHPKTQVIGVAAGGAARAYPLPAVRERGPVNDTVGGRPVVVAVAADDRTLVAYDRRVDGETLTFEADGSHLAAGGSRWEILTGEAVDGPHEGTELTSAAGQSQLFWFTWLDFHPDTTVFGADS